MPRSQPCSAHGTFDDALAILVGNASPLDSEWVRIERAGRRILAAPVCAALDAPRYDAAAMDGFAVREEDLRLTRQFRVIGQCYPGDPWAGVVGRGEAVRIMTGARVPDGAGRVLPIELVTQTADGFELDHDPPQRSHIRARGSDMAAGAIALDAGTELTPRNLLVAAAADADRLNVVRQPRVAVIASGNELVAPGTARDTPGAIPDSLSEAVLLMARQWGGKPAGATRVADDCDAIRTLAAGQLGGCDVLVMVGGASRGDRDYARAALNPLGLELGFSTVAMKPGKPVWYGRIGGCHVLGLPGNPTAAFTVARLFMAPLLSALSGHGAHAALAWQQLPLASALPPAGDRESFLCATMRGDAIEVIARQSAASQLMLARADRLVRRPAGDGAREAGEHVATLRF